MERAKGLLHQEDLRSLSGEPVLPREGVLKKARADRTLNVEEPGDERSRRENPREEEPRAREGAKSSPPPNPHDGDRRSGGRAYVR